MSKDKKILVRIKSHRARDGVEATLKAPRDTYHSFCFEGEFIWVSQEEWDEISAIKGVGKARVDETKLRKCWVRSCPLEYGNYER